MERSVNWETAEKVQKNDQGQFRAMIGGEWVPVEKAQKNESGQYRIMRAQEKTSLPEEDASLANKIKGSAKEVAVDLPRAALYWGLHKPAMAGTQLLFNALASGSEAVAPDTKVSKYLRGEAARSDELAQRMEKNYQELVPDNPASYAGATIGAVMPFSKAGYLKGSMETAGKVGKPVESVTKAVLKSPKSAKYAGKVVSGTGMGAAGSLASPVTEEGDYWDNLIGKTEIGVGVGAAIPAIGIPLLKAGKWGAEKAKEIITPWFEKLRTSAGRQYLDDALGSSKQKVINAINEYYQPSQIGPQPQVKLGPATTADIIAGANVGKTDKFGSQLVKAEQQLSSQGGGISDAAKSIHAAQEAARAAEIGKIAQTPEALAAAEAARASSAATNYGKAYNNIFNTTLTPDTELVQMSQNPFFKRAMNEVSDLAKAKGVDFKTNPTQYLHYVKIGLDKLLGRTGDTALASTEKEAVTGLQKQLVKWMTEKNPAYGSARQSFQAESIPINQMQVGQELQKALAGATGKERATVFAGAARDAGRTIDRAVGGPAKESLGDILNPQQMASTDKVTRALLRETEKRNLASNTEVRDLFNIVEGAKGSFQFPHLLSRPMVFGNWLFKITGNSADDLIAKDIGNLLIKDPQKFAQKYLTDVPPSKVSTAIQELQKMKMQSLIAPSTQFAIQENK